MSKKYYIQTFGCQQNVADSERIASYYQTQGFTRTDNILYADHVVINTCMIREMAENRIYGLVNNLVKKKKKDNIPKKIIVTGCIVGMAVRDKTGKYLSQIRRKMSGVDEFLPIEEIGFDHVPLRNDIIHAWIPISNGCNNFCTFCVVPFSRGREISRSYKEILDECIDLSKKGYRKITLLGMNVNSYGADLVVGSKNVQVLRDFDRTYFDREKHELKYVKGYRLPDGRTVKPVHVKHLNRLRIPTLFPSLLSDICKVDLIEHVDFMSSKPWDFSNELIEVIKRNPKITRQIHLPVQSGSNEVLKRMNRWYTREQYINLIEKIRTRIPDVKFSTDIIVGFCGETEKEYNQTVELVKQVGFCKAYIAMYSDRPMTVAHKVFKDDVPHKLKKQRWQILEEIINIPNLTLKKNIC